MPNASTIRRQIAGTQQLTIAPILGTVVTTTETVFQLNNNGLTLTGGGYIPLSAGVTGLYQGTGQVLWLHADGTLTATSANGATLAIKVYQTPAANLPFPAPPAETSAIVIAASNVIAAPTAGTLAAGRTSGSFFVDLYIQLDSQGNLTGSYEGETFTTVTANTALTQVTGLVGEADLNFLVTATQGVAETGNVVTLAEFSLNFV